MFDHFDALLLARIQFGFTVAFHIIFPALTIGLANYLAVLEGAWLVTKKTVYRDLYHYWSRIFAVNFGMGVVSGLVMAYQFGTNWSGYSDFAGSVTGPLLAYEVLTAFFLEAGFLGVMLFGWKKVGPGLHFFSTIMVALGTLTSMTWILASNSWMQTPAGYEIVDGRVVPVDWLAVIFNASFPYRLTHMGIAAFLSTALFVGAAGAWHLLRGDRTPAVKTMTSMAMWMLLIVAPLQAVVGDFHGINTLEHQPAKIAAMEGHWENKPGEAVPLTLFGWPDMDKEETRFAVQIPHLGSLILTHSWDGQFRGLKDFAVADRPNSTVVFWSFRAMVGLGFGDDRAGTVGSLGALARPAVRVARAAARDGADGPRRPCRDHRGLDHHRSRPSAVGGLWPDAHGRCDVAGQQRDAGRHLACAVRDRLFPGIRCRHGVCAAAGRRRAHAA